ncbi:MAG: glycosyltransferase family 4 protein [Akkermansia sp.]|nr:glycosyltransferase family 4 protein [Akkermansia sp.]
MQKPHKKRIAILSDYPYWNYFDNVQPESHPAPWLAALQQAFARETHSPYELHWITLTKNVKKMQTCCVDGQYMYLLPAGSRALAQYMRYLPDRWRVGRLLKQLAPDLVHAWGTEGCYGLIAKDFEGKKLFSYQGALTAYAQRANMGSFMVRQARFEKSVLKAMPVITVESEWSRDRVYELIPGADVRLWEYAAEERFFNVERKLSPEPLCVMLTSDSHIKNVETAIAAFSRPELQHVKLYMMGVSPEKYNNLTENIVPLGRIARHEISGYLQQAWAMVHTSLADTGPTAVKEARAAGLPCIVSSACGAKRYVVPGKSGYIFEPLDVQGLVSAVLSVTADADTSLTMGSYDIERCREELSAAVMYRKISALYEELTGE